MEIEENKNTQLTSKKKKKKKMFTKLSKWEKIEIDRIAYLVEMQTQWMATKT